MFVDLNRRFKNNLYQYYRTDGRKNAVRIKKHNSPVLFAVTPRAEGELSSSAVQSRYAEVHFQQNQFFWQVAPNKQCHFYTLCKFVSKKKNEKTTNVLPKTPRIRRDLLETRRLYVLQFQRLEGTRSRMFVRSVHVRCSFKRYGNVVHSFEIGNEREQIRHFIRICSISTSFLLQQAVICFYL